MEKKYLIINLGSASKKYALFSENIELYYTNLEQSGIAQVSETSWDSSLEYILDNLVKNNLIKNKTEITAVAIRIVVPGSYFLKTQIIDEQYKQRLIKAKQKSSLHIDLILKELDSCQQLLHGVSVIGVSDSAFHANMPESARVYAIDQKIAEQLDIYRFGYHGISCESIVNKLKESFNNLPENIIICHLGSGSSVTAIKNGKSIETSMGFSPLEGIPMLTRVGNIDASAVLYLQSALNLSDDTGVTPNLLNYFYKNSGLFALTGEHDMRNILKLEESGDLNAQLALELYINSIKKYIGSYIAILSNLNMLIFTGAIGERSSIIRSKICAGLEIFGISLDINKNNKLVDDGFIESENSHVKIAVLKTQEMAQIAREIKNFF